MARKVEATMIAKAKTETVAQPERSIGFVWIYANDWVEVASQARVQIRAFSGLVLERWREIRAAMTADAQVSLYAPGSTHDGMRPATRDELAALDRGDRGWRGRR